MNHGAQNLTMVISLCGFIAFPPIFAMALILRLIRRKD